MTPAGQLLIEIVEHEIAKEGRERAALRRPLVHRTDQTILHHSGLEKSPDEPEHAFIRHPRGNPRHQAIVIDSVEKFFEIKIDHDAVALGNVSLRLGHRLVGRSPRSEAVAVLGERWVPSFLENLQQGLLDQPVDDARHAELSDPAIRLGYFDPLDRLRLIGSREQLRPNTWPVLTSQAGLSGIGFATGGSVPWRPRTGASPRLSGTKASAYWMFCRVPLMSCQSYLPLSIVRAFGHRFRIDLSVAPPFGLGVPH